jgi:hypothetical protein
VIFHIPYGNSVPRYFSQLEADSIAELDVIFFGTRSLILSEIPETLDQFSLYVVVSRLSKTNSHLCFRDSEGWLSIRGRDIEEASFFRRDNISLLGYIRDLNSTNVFRFPLTCDHLVRRPSGKLRSRPVTDISHPGFAQAQKASLVALPEIRRDFAPFDPEKRISVVFWSDPEKSSWGSEQRKSIDIKCNATGSDLLKAMGERLDPPRDLSTSYEVFKVFPDLEQAKMISPTEMINANDCDVFHIQPTIPPDQACQIVLSIGSKTDAHPIDFRRIRLSSGQVNLNTDIPQNSFQSIVAKLVGGFDRVNDIDVVMVKNGVRISESDGIFALGPPVAKGVKHLSHVRFTVKSGFQEFDRLTSDRRERDQLPLAHVPQSIPTILPDLRSIQQFPESLRKHSDAEQTIRESDEPPGADKTICSPMKG